MWAWNQLGRYGSSLPEIIEAAQRSRKQNVFLHGYLSHSSYGPSTSYKGYFDFVLGSISAKPDIAAVTKATEKLGIKVLNFNEWSGFVPKLWAERERLQEIITEKRTSRNTYKKTSQVQAEAEVVILITGIRDNELSPAGIKASTGFFLSHSRVMDGLSGWAQRIVMPPEFLLEWLLSVKEVTQADADAVFDQLLWEITETGVEVIHRDELLRIFHGTVEASASKFEDMLREHRQLITEDLTRDPQQAFSETDDLLKPLMNQEVRERLMAKLEKKLSSASQRLKESEARRIMAEKQATRAASELQKFSKEKAKKEGNRRKQKNRKRSKSK